MQTRWEQVYPRKWGIVRIQPRAAYNFGATLAASLALGLLFLRMEGFASRNPRLLEVGICVNLILTGVLFYMGNGQSDQPNQQLSESAQNNASINGSTISGSVIDASAVTHHSHNGIGGKYILVIFLVVATALGVYFYYHRHDQDCASVSNGDVVSNGSGSKAISGNCNADDAGKKHN